MTPVTVRTALVREVGCAVDGVLGEPAALVLAIAVADGEGLSRSERLRVAVDGRALDVAEHPGPVGTRWHTVDAPAGVLRVEYEAMVRGRARPATVTPLERILDVRPSRFVQSDILPALVDSEVVRAFADLPPLDRLGAVREAVSGALEYSWGSTRPTDGLAEPLEAGAGVCRDFAHVVAGLLRATDLPARVVSVYAPGLDPMDFHAAVEVAVGDEWLLVDATGRAPRRTMVRIATGRDAADTAFLASDGSALALTAVRVRAEANDPSPERPSELVALG
ncbi:transglutaminase-like domain-containing protein [Microcella alkalica]|uniref:Transglutaminase-like putative cysteine protease n=1 Tax=Microcella alkalica TaxID=355930 RepID=A0A839E5Z5_9MICO|nr:transglutaminase family protein [Microcella alkalica]MBA8846746.1 transglutaminase-like putative cysteine protease [Microcella alkalica]